MSDTITFLKAALAGEKVDGEYETSAVKRFRLTAKLEQPNQNADKLRCLFKANLNAYINSPGYAGPQVWLGHGDEIRESWAK